MTTEKSVDILALTEALCGLRVLRSYLINCLDSSKAERDANTERDLLTLITYLNDVLELREQGLASVVFFDLLDSLLKPLPDPTDPTPTLELLYSAAEKTRYTREKVREFMNLHSCIEQILNSESRPLCSYAVIPAIEPQLCCYVKSLREFRDEKHSKEFYSLLLEYIRPYEA